MTLSNAKPFIAGNWKMYKTIPEAQELVSALMAGSADMIGSRNGRDPPLHRLSKIRQDPG